MVVFYAFFPEQKRLQKDLHKPTPMDFPGIKHWAESIRLHNSTGPNIHSLIWFPQTFVPLSNSHTLLRICLPFSIWPSMTADYRSSLRTHSIYYGFVSLFQAASSDPLIPIKRTSPPHPRQTRKRKYTYIPKRKKEKKKRTTTSSYPLCSCQLQQRTKPASDEKRHSEAESPPIQPAQASDPTAESSPTSYCLYFLLFLQSSTFSPTPYWLLSVLLTPPPSLFLCHNITTTRRSPNALEHENPILVSVSSKDFPSSICVSVCVSLWAWESAWEREREGACGGGVDLGLEALSSDAHSVFFCSLIVLLLLLLCLSVLFLTNLLYYCVMGSPLAGVELQTSSFSRFYKGPTKFIITHNSRK
jgi:hypothetical protein